MENASFLSRTHPIRRALTVYLSKLIKMRRVHSPGLYPCSRSNAEARELLRDELRPVTSDPSTTFRGKDKSKQKASIKVRDIAKPFSKRTIHFPGKIEQTFQDGQEVLIGLPLCGNIDGLLVVGNVDGITTCKECRSIARHRASTKAGTNP